MLSLNATLAQAFIRSQPWHGSLSAEQQARLLGRLNFVKGAKGDCLLAAGCSDDSDTADDTSGTTRAEHAIIASVRYFIARSPFSSVSTNEVPRRGLRVPTPPRIVTKVPSDAPCRARCPDMGRPVRGPDGYAPATIHDVRSTVGDGERSIGSGLLLRHLRHLLTAADLDVWLVGRTRTCHLVHENGTALLTGVAIPSSARHDVPP